MYVKGAHAILFVYDVTNLESFDKIKLLLNDKTIQQSNATMFLIGNKLDLPCVIDFNEVKSFAKEHLMHHHELTATSYHDVKQLFMTVASLLINQYPQSIEDNVVLTNDKKTNCCY
jgi:GTPase SAR1 family protein